MYGEVSLGKILGNEEGYATSEQALVYAEGKHGLKPGRLRIVNIRHVGDTQKNEPRAMMLLEGLVREEGWPDVLLLENPDDHRFYLQTYVHLP